MRKNSRSACLSGICLRRHCARAVSGGTVPLYMIPVMIFLPIGIGIVTGLVAGMLLKRFQKKAGTLTILLAGITATAMIGLFFNTKVFTNISLNYMLMGVAFSAIFSNMLPEEQLNDLTEWFHPILAVIAAKKGFELAGEITTK